MLNTKRSRVRPRPIVLVCLTLVFLGAASAAKASVSDPSVKVPQPQPTDTNPGQAIFRSATRFTTIEMLCLQVSFDISDPLDPGETLRFTPNSWLEVNELAAGPGFSNVGSSPQFDRTLCAVQLPGFPLDSFISEFLDGKEVLKLQAVGSVLISRIDVEIIASTA
jgi:hypothetical protein